MKMNRRWLWLVLALALGLQAACAQTPAAGKKAAGKATAAVALVDLNSAGVEELKKLPGIGEAYAAKIVKGRPYRGKNELVQRGVLPEGVYEKIKDRVIARQK
jgi:competence protein ComEA